jgi:hypothetical protein
MPVDNNQKGVKNVQTLLAPKKPGAIDKDLLKKNHQSRTNDLIQMWQMKVQKELI